MNRINAAIVLEDHVAAARALSDAVDEAFQPTTLVHASTLKHGLELIENAAYDLALVDIGLPDGSGVTFIERFVACCPSALVLVTTIFDDDRSVLEAIRAGAHGYILKGHDAGELQNLLIEASLGKPALSPSIALSVLRLLRRDKTEGGVEALTEREIEVLNLIAKGLSVKETARLLDISTNTVSYHIKNVYAKLNINSRAEATIAAIRMNLLDPD